MNTYAEPVSFDSESLILVDADDNEIGHLSKVDCHRDHGILHRAFSVFLFDRDGRLLLQQRSAQKPLWPLYWSNSCCSHPRRGESIELATARRLQEELGVKTQLHWLYKFTYQADYDDRGEHRGAEHELCHVLIGTHNGEVRVHPDEIAAWRWLSVDQINQELSEQPEQFTPWFKLEWETLLSDWQAEIRALYGQRKSA